MGVPDDQATPLQNGFGLFFTVFCCWYFFRVVKKRAARAKNIRLSKFQSVRLFMPQLLPPLILASFREYSAKVVMMKN
tara:strand:+ start:716 stop:949 length:234 start_codon:yes stop_codon:yes gene_type:complete